MVVYESMFGNTEAIARSISDGAASRGATVIVHDVESAPDRIDHIDILIVGAPTHALGMSRPRTRQAARAQGAAGRGDHGVREWLSRLDRPSRRLTAACFDTRIRKPLLFGSAARSIRRRLRRLGFDVVKPISFTVTDTPGPLARRGARACPRLGRIPRAGDRRDGRAAAMSDLDPAHLVTADRIDRLDVSLPSARPRLRPSALNPAHRGRGRVGPNGPKGAGRSRAGDPCGRPQESAPRAATRSAPPIPRLDGCGVNDPTRTSTSTCAAAGPIAPSTLSPSTRWRRRGLFLYASLTTAYQTRSATVWTRSPMRDSRRYASRRPITSRRSATCSSADIALRYACSTRRWPLIAASANSVASPSPARPSERAGEVADRLGQQDHHLVGRSVGRHAHQLHLARRGPSPRSAPRPGRPTACRGPRRRAAARTRRGAPARAGASSRRRGARSRARLTAAVASPPDQAMSASIASTVIAACSRSMPRRSGLSGRNQRLAFT